MFNMIIVNSGKVNSVKYNPPNSLKRLAGNKKGFTLVELLVSVAIFAVVIALVYGIFTNARRAQTRQEALVGMAREARGGVEQMIREVRMAGAQSTTSASACIDAEDKIRLIEGAPTSIEFEGDVDLDRVLERVRYTYDSNSKVLSRWQYKIENETNPAWNAPATRCGQSLTISGLAASLIDIQPVSFGLDAFDIKYYNNSNVIINSPSVASADLGNVTKIAISITAKNEAQPTLKKSVMVEIKLPNMGTKHAGTDITPPQTPATLTVTDIKVCGYMKVAWAASPDTDLAGYKVYYKPRLPDGSYPAEWYGIRTVGKITSMDISGLQNGAVYRVGIASYDTSGNISGVREADLAAPLNDNILPDPPATLTAVKDNDAGTITLTWGQGKDKDSTTPTPRNADYLGAPFPVSYSVYRDTSATGTFATLLNAQPIAPITNTTFVDTVPEKCQTYYYKMKSVDACGNTGSLSTAAGGDPATKIVVTDVAAPVDFYPGGGTTLTSSPPGNYTQYAWARFSGKVGDDPHLDTTTPVVIEYLSASTCQAAPTQKGQGQGNLQWKEIPDGYNWTQPTGAAGASFTSRWGGVYKEEKVRFAAYTKNKCGNYSSPAVPNYCIDKCQDSTTYPTNAGLGDACLYNPGDPVKGLVCDRVKLFWTTKQDGLLPAACTAGRDADPSKRDFYPDYGDGGYLVYRAIADGAESFKKLAPDPVTGPLQPFYYIDGFYDGAINTCEYVASGNITYYRDRCKYRYRLRAVDCTALEANASATLATQIGGGFFAPGKIGLHPDLAVDVAGTKKNKVLFYVENTAAAALTWKKAQFNWVDAAARLTKVEICNPEPGSSADGCNSWSSMWAAANNSSGVASGTLVTFTSEKTLAASPVLGAGDPIKARVRLTFYTTGGSAQRMDDNNEIIRVVPHWENASSTYDNKTCPAADDLTPGYFEVATRNGPGLGAATQNPPTGAAYGGGDNAITGTPPANNYRSYAYDTVYTKYFVDNVAVRVRAPITPISAAYPVAQCGDTANNRGVILYYRITNNTVATPAEPVDASGNESLRSPVNYTKLAMCNEAVAAQCSGGTCIYYVDFPAQIDKRIWYYIIAYDTVGNFTLAPDQPGDIFTTAYNYDAKEMVFRYIWLSGVSHNAGTGKLSIGSLWASRIKNGSFGDPVDTGTAGASVQIDLSSGAASETINRMTISKANGCLGCWDSESGLAEAVESAVVFPAPTVADPINIRVTTSKAGYPSKTCVWNYDGASLVNVGGDSECKP